jgi:hypothetical protein
MPDNSDEVIRLLLEFRSEPDPAVFAQKMDVLKGAITQLGGSYDVAERKVGEYAVAEGGAALAMDKRTEAAYLETIAQRNLNAMLDEAVGGQKALATHVETTTTATGGMGRGILQASYAVQDFTSVLSGGGGLSRALGSVQNNIPVVLASLGLGAGMAGTISLVSVGLGAAIPLVEQFVGGWDAEGMKAKAKALENLREEYDKFKNSLTDQQAETKSRVEDFMKGVDKKVIAGGIEAGLRSEGFGKDEKEEAELASAADQQARGYQFGAIELDRLEQLRKNRAQRIADEAAKITGRMATDPSEMARVMDLAAKHPDNFPTGFREGLQETTPAGFDAAEAAGQADVEAAEQFGQRAHDAGVKRRENARERRLGNEDAERLAQDMREMGVDARKDKDKVNDEAEQLAADMRALGREAAVDDQKRAAKAAKAADPLAMLGAEQKRQESDVAAFAMNQWERGGRQESPDMLRRIIRDATGRLPDYGGDVAEAVNAAVNAGYEKAMMQQQRAMNRMAQQQMTRLGY